MKELSTKRKIYVKLNGIVKSRYSGENQFSLAGFRRGGFTPHEFIWLAA